MPNETLTIRDEPPHSVMEVFEEFIRTREVEDPPAPELFVERLPDDDSKRSFRELVESFSWTQDLLPRNVQPNVVLAGRFRLIERLGAGGMGQVWRAVDQKIGREVAVKVMSLISSPTIDSEAAFQRETELLAQLKHPGIVSVLDSDRDEEHRFLVMDLVEGHSLETVLERIKAAVDPDDGVRGRAAADILRAVGVDLPAGHQALLDGDDWCDGVVKVMVEILLTLEAAHARKVVHRDLKPGNLMITPGGQPVLLDFGLGGRIDSAPGDLTSSLFGTFRFVAPEQLSRGTSGTDVRTDVYQLGVVFYEFLTLRECFSSRDHAELFRLISHGDFKAPRALDRGIPRELEDIVLRAIDADPSHRYQTATEFREALQRFLRREPVHMDRYSSVQRFSRSFRYTMRKHRPLVLGMTGVVLAGLLAWFARDAFAETATMEAMVVAPDGAMEFDLRMSKDQYFVGIADWKEAGTTFYRPVVVVVDGDRPEVLKPVHLKKGLRKCKAQLPQPLLAKAGLQLTNFFAGDIDDLARLEASVSRMRGATRTKLGVDAKWMKTNWDVKMRGGPECPDLPLEEVFGSGDRKFDRVETQRVEIPQPGKLKPGKLKSGKLKSGK